MPADGIAVLNYDNEYVREMSRVFPGKKIIYYGLTGEADLYADNIVSTRTGMEFDVHYGNEVEKTKIG